LESPTVQSARLTDKMDQGGWIMTTTTKVPAREALRRLHELADSFASLAVVGPITARAGAAHDSALVRWAAETIERLDVEVYSSRSDADEAMIDFDNAEVELPSFD
jgi:hypothetical protein